MKNWIIYGVGALLIIGGVFGWRYAYQEPDSFAFTISDEDMPVSWDFKGLYEGNPELTNRAQTEIKRLEDLLDKKDAPFPKYELYVSIANQYDLLGDGEKEYQYLKYALAIDSEKTGLAWSNLGALLQRVGAYRSARAAFEKSIAAQPFPQYRQAYLDFLLKQYPGDPAIKAEQDALKK